MGDDTKDEAQQQWPPDASEIADEAGLGYLGGNSLPGYGDLPDAFWDAMIEHQQMVNDLRRLDRTSVIQTVAIGILIGLEIVRWAFG